ncbi:ATP-binding protein [Massilia sp. PWRC2]|uniref:chemotaxis protein CheA n=1 Tax=Massilia sp. PWRC2 TaxID=2804626 RepID=UPI003CF38D42
MTALLQQFLSEARDGLQGIGERLIELESAPADSALMDELFRLVHTLKGNAGLFELPEVSRVLHAAEDLMVAVREGARGFDVALADRLLAAMDFVSLLLDELGEGGEGGGARHAATSAALAQSLRALLGASAAAAADAAAPPQDTLADSVLAALPPSVLAAWRARPADAAPLWWLSYTPEPECFFKGEDPFYHVLQSPQILWQQVRAAAAWPPLAQLDAYRCALSFDVVSDAPRAALDEHFRYVPEQVSVLALLLPALAPAAAAASGDGADALPSRAAIGAAICAAQLGVLAAPDTGAGLAGRLRAAAVTIAGCLRSMERRARLPALDAALASALAADSGAPLHDWLLEELTAAGAAVVAVAAVVPVAAATEAAAAAAAAPAAEPDTDAAPAHQRRQDDGVKTLKVDQTKVDHLMNLIGEMVVAKNSLPYLAARAENVFGVRELAREIKSQYAVINRIAEEMQDAIMQVRMMPVSFVFQRFPRLVRDLSRKLGKEVNLVLEGEHTEADKNIIEALADPLIHIVRNSLDHGLELPAVRLAAGKHASGRLLIRAAQEGGRVIIDISDDGKGIDPEVVKARALERGLIDAAQCARMSERDALNLVFAAGFSTAEVVSDLSGRGVGMDVVRSAVEQVHGTVELDSTVGQGTRLRLSLPLSMALSHVMIIEAGGQIFGVPMDIVVETVRLPRSAVHTLKNASTAVLRERIVPLRTLDQLLVLGAPPRANDHDELATLVVRINGEPVGLVIDDFREVAGIILKPLGGVLGSLPGYSGSALLGDGAVLMVLNLKELI